MYFMKKHGGSYSWAHCGVLYIYLASSNAEVHANGDAIPYTSGFDLHTRDSSINAKFYTFTTM